MRESRYFYIWKRMAHVTLLISQKSEFVYVDILRELEHKWPD